MMLASGGTRGALILALSMALPMGAQESYRVSGPDVAVYNLAGRVEVVGGSGSDVTVQVSPGGDDGHRLSVEVGEVGGRMTLRVVYPEDRIIYPVEGRGRYSVETRVRGDGTFGDGWGGERVRILSSGSGLEAHADLRIEVPRGTRLRVHNAVGDARATDIRSDLDLDLRTGAVEVTDMEGNLMVDTGSGSVRVRNQTGGLEVDTGSGGVTLERVEGPRVLVDTGSGSVEGRGIRASRVDVDTGSGSIDLQELRSADVRVDTGSGSVSLGFLETVESLWVDSGSGSVTIAVPAGLDAEIEVETGSGGIDVDIPTDVRTLRRNHFRGTAGQGRGRIFIDTGSGRVRLISN